MTVKLLPQRAADETKSEPGNSGKNTGCDDDAEEIPEAANERPALELRREQSPRKRCSSDEAGEESDISREVLYGRAAKMVELGKNRCPR